MTATPAAINVDTALAEMEKHLTSQLNDEQRQSNFDMDDGPEVQVLTPFPEFNCALDWLGVNVTALWRRTDEEAVRSQAKHQTLAHVAIAAGFGAIILAIFQLAIKATGTEGGFEIASVVFETLAVVAAIIAVGVGLAAKVSQRWREQRNRAERLRMLKYSALVQFCSCSVTWQEWVNGKLKDITKPPKVLDWAEGGDVDPEMPSLSNCDPQSSSFRALVLYYRFKRIKFQANFFQRRSGEKRRKTIHLLHRADLPIFYSSVALVLAHFALSGLGNQLPEWSEVLGKVAVWCGAFAAMIPIAGLGVHAWFDAFELPRSASLFAAKKQALDAADIRVQKDSNSAQATVGHMSSTEHFLDLEHREWLRLLNEARWFV